MMLYNETIGIDKDIEEQFLRWLKNHYVPSVMNTKLFIEFKIFKVLTHDDETSTSYSIQFFSTTIEDVVSFVDNYSKPLVEEQQLLFKDKHITFRTLLEQVD
jgi:hypothetical protein